MRILCIDATSSFLDFALRAEAEGHEVRVFMANCKDGSRSTVGDGLIHKVSDFRGSMKWADLICVSDNCKYMRELEPYRQKGFPLFCSNLEGTSWEMDRTRGSTILEDHGISCLPHTEFSRFDDAIAFQLANWKKRFVCKPCADVDKSLSYVSKSGKDMVFMLQKWKKEFPHPPKFIFQEFCPGIEMAVGAWVGKNGFLGFVAENFEFKKLMPGEIGVNTGEMGTVMKYCSFEESRLAQEVLCPLEPELIRNGYTGYIDVAVMIGTEGERKGQPNPMEFTSRHGWPAEQILQVLHPDIANWKKDALEGRDTFRPYRDIVTGVVMAIPDFPYGKLKVEDVSGYPVWGVTPKNRYNVHPCEVKLGEALGDNGKPEPIMVSAGNYVVVVTGTAPDVSGSIERAYETVKELEIPNSPIYRNDIGCRLEKQLPKLQKMGYATSWIW